MKPNIIINVGHFQNESQILRLEMEEGIEPLHQQQSPSDFSKGLFQSTQSRGRTGTTVKLLVFETNASTDSAIWAFPV
jgi:hypothetical protein